MITKIKTTLALTSLLLIIVSSIQLTNANNVVSSDHSSAVTDEFNTSLSENEFNALLLSSLANDENGRLLLSVSDALSAKLYTSHVEFTAVINLEKVEQISPEARASVQKFSSFFLFLDKNRLNLKVYGEPETRHGLVGIRDNFSIELGPIPLSNEALRQLGLDVDQASNISLKLNDLYVHAIDLLNGQVNLATD